VARGFISPLLANLYLHWFDKVFNGPDGPAQWANSRLVRYADDFVALARYQGEKPTGFIESKIETWLQTVSNIRVDLAEGNISNTAASGPSVRRKG
jgi:RNA-directed DNA polymerase